jgi:hypothetical protein
MDSSCVGNICDRSEFFCFFYLARRPSFDYGLAVRGILVLAALCFWGFCPSSCDGYVSEIFMVETKIFVFFILLGGVFLHSFDYGAWNSCSCYALFLGVSPLFLQEWLLFWKYLGFEAKIFVFSSCSAGFPYICSIVVRGILVVAALCFWGFRPSSCNG